VPDSFGFSHPTELGKYQFGDMSWSDLLCRDSKKTLFITFNDQLPKVWKVEGYLYVIKDFSGVHTQVEFIDIGIIRQYLTEMNLIDEACLNKIN